MSWSFAILVLVDLPLMSAIAAKAMRTLDDFGPQSMSLTLWSFASLRVMNEPLMTSIASAARRKICEFQMHHLTKFAWASAVLPFPIH